MTTLTNDQAREIIAELLTKEHDTPTWRKVIDLCFWAKEGMAENRFRDRQGVKRDRRHYMKLYMRNKRAKLTGPSTGSDGTHSQELDTNTVSSSSS